jgi:hypothetical protein
MKYFIEVLIFQGLVNLFSSEETMKLCSVNRGIQVVNV